MWEDWKKNVWDVLMSHLVAILNEIFANRKVKMMHIIDNEIMFIFLGCKITELAVGSLSYSAKYDVETLHDILCCFFLTAKPTFWHPFLDSSSTKVH